MKKIMILVALLISVTTLMGQRSERTNAFMYNRNGEYEKAREAIDKAIEHPKRWKMLPPGCTGVLFT